MKKRQKGFSLIEALLIVVMVGLIGFVGWYIYHAKSSTNKAYDHLGSMTNNLSFSKKDNAENPKTWLTYKNDEGKLTFQYPKNWQIAVEDTTRYDDGSFGGVSGTLKSPSGRQLTWVYNVIGGKGDAGCTPNPGDVPFAVSNNCFSKQILSVEKIPSVLPPTKNVGRNLFEDSLYITHTKYRPSGNDTKITYQICLDPFYNDDPPPQIGINMGFFLPCEYWDTGFNVKFEVPDLAGFNSADAKTAEQIMQSFNSL